MTRRAGHDASGRAFSALQTLHALRLVPFFGPVHESMSGVAALGWGDECPTMG
jgi:hypothetical protein